MLVSILTLLWVVNAARHQRVVALSLPPRIVILFVLPLVWAIVQISGFMFGSAHHPLWELSAQMLGTPIQSAISITPDNTLVSVMRLASYGLVFFLSFQYARNPHRAHTMLKWFAITGIFYALYGLVVYWGDLNVLFWTEAAENVNKVVTSTFVNRNSYVTYAGLGLLCLMALSLAPSSTHGSPYRPVRSRSEIVEYYVLRSWKPLLGIMLITTALVSTRSRGGFIAAGPAVITLLLIYGIKMKLNTKTLLASISGVLVIIGLAYSVSNDGLLTRMEHIDTGGNERLQVYAMTLDAIGDSALPGFGYGSYYEGFRMYHNEEVGNIYDKAHNTYLENIFELGFPAAVSLFLALFGLMWLSLKGSLHRHRDWIYPATGVAASVLVGIHSLVDFSLQIPAIAITYSAIMGMAVAQSFSSARHHA